MHKINFNPLDVCNGRKNPNVFFELSFLDELNYYRCQQRTVQYRYLIASKSLNNLPTGAVFSKTTLIYNYVNTMSLNKNLEYSILFLVLNFLFSGT